jgi:hypothetical protein
MKKFYLIIAFLFLVSANNVAHSYELSCERDVSESQLLKQSPNGATRISKHILEVKYSGGSKRFIDKPPHEDLDGIHWHYCGYSRDVRIHLIGKQISGLFTGTILFEDTGKTLLAGQTVFVAPNMKYILGREQANGVDGETWSLFNIAGARLWSGYAGITKIREINGKPYDAVYAQFEKPRWDGASNVAADFVCSDGSKKGSVTLTLIKNQWKWLPEYQCKSN